MKLFLLSALFFVSCSGSSDPDIDKEPEVERYSVSRAGGLQKSTKYIATRNGNSAAIEKITGFGSSGDKRMIHGGHWTELTRLIFLKQMWGANYKDSGNLAPDGSLMVVKLDNGLKTKTVKQAGRLDYATEDFEGLLKSLWEKAKSPADKKLQP